MNEIIKIHYTYRFYELVKRNLDLEDHHKNHPDIFPSFTDLFSKDGNLFSISFYELMAILGYSNEEINSYKFDYDDHFKKLFFFLCEAMALANSDRLDNKMLYALILLSMYLSGRNERALMFLRVLNEIYISAENKALQETRLINKKIRN